MNEIDIQKVSESYERCLGYPEFWDDFYDAFLASSDEIRQMFANTDFERQKQIVALSVKTLIMYIHQPENEDVKQEMERLAVIHDRNHVNVKPELYAVWLDTLLANVEAHDPLCNIKLIDQWRRCLKPGIAYFKEKY